MSNVVKFMEGRMTIVKNDQDGLMNSISCLLEYCNKCLTRASYTCQDSRYN